MRLAPGWPAWVLTPLSLAAGLAAATTVWPWAAYPAGVLALLAAGLAVFFRDPDRAPGSGIVAAADGRIQAVDDGAVTFLNLHHVHVVRAPFEGTVAAVERIEGPRWPAFLERAEKNGGVAITVETAWGTKRLDLIAGLVARRAVAFVDEGDRLAKGQRVGMIRLGSRVDVDLPQGAEPAVEPGDRVRAGETTIAHAPDGGEASR